MFPALLGMNWAAKALIAAAVAAALVLAYVGWRGKQREFGRNEIRAQVAAQAAQEAEHNARETLRRVQRQSEASNAAQTQLAAARAAAARASAAADSLRTDLERFAAAGRAACAHPAVAGERSPAGDAIGVLAELQRRADERAGILAAAADDARIAGAACESSYDALSR